MELTAFFIASGIASIVSLFVSLITLFKVIKINTNIKLYDNSDSSQTIKSKTITTSDVTQIGHDSK